MMLLSHHQLVSAYDEELGDELASKLAPILNGRTDAWLWGHEHRCMAFKPATGRPPITRCIGHGGVPIPFSDKQGPLPEPGLWEETGTFDEHDSRWNRFGFAVLDFAGPVIDIRYRDDGGTQTRVERI
jgi:hypothetical protein